MTDRPSRPLERDPDPAASAPAAPLDGLSFYDDERILTRYQALRQRTDTPSRTLEQPAVLAFLGDLQGRTVLDLGCGDAWIGRYALEHGAVRYLGLDGSRKMLEEALRTLAGTGGEVRLQDLEQWSGDSGGPFDVVVSRLALQYVRNLPQLLDAVRRQLRPQGLFVFSIEHPVLTSSYDGEIEGGIASAWRVHDYFREGTREDHWLGAIVLKQHRALETYFHELRRCGLQIDRFSEGRPEVENFSDRKCWERRLDVPLCAIFRCIRHA